MKVTIEIPPSEVHTIVEGFMQQKFEGTVSNLRPIIVEDWVGYGMQERKAFVFKGYQCEVDMSKKQCLTVDDWVSCNKQGGPDCQGCIHPDKPDPNFALSHKF